MVGWWVGWLSGVCVKVCVCGGQPVRALDQNTAQRGVLARARARADKTSKHAATRRTFGQAPHRRARHAEHELGHVDAPHQRAGRGVEAVERAAPVFFVCVCVCGGGGVAVRGACARARAKRARARVPPSERARASPTGAPHPIPRPVLSSSSPAGKVDAPRVHRGRRAHVAVDRRVPLVAQARRAAGVEAGGLGFRV